MGELYREPISPDTAKRALSSYIKGLIQDFYNETGQHIHEIKITSKIEDNKWQVKDIEIVPDLLNI